MAKPCPKIFPNFIVITQGLSSCFEKTWTAARVCFIQFLNDGNLPCYLFVTIWAVGSQTASKAFVAIYNTGGFFPVFFFFCLFLKYKNTSKVWWKELF